LKWKTIKQLFLSFQLKVPVFFLVWGSYVVSCCRVFYYGLSVCRLILVPCIFLPVGIAFALAYSHYFIETKTGFCKRFIWLFLISLILLELISYLWLIKGVIF